MPRVRPEEQGAALAPEDTQRQALTIEQYRRLIHQIEQIILADGGTAGARPPTQEMALDAGAPESTDSPRAIDEPVADEPVTQGRQRAA